MQYVKDMITKEQYIEILDIVQRYKRYMVMNKKVFPHNPMTEDFAAGMQKVLDLTQTLVKKD